MGARPSVTCQAQRIRQAYIIVTGVQDFWLILEAEEALIRAQAIAAMEKPAQPDMKRLQEFLQSTKMEDLLIGNDRNVWGSIGEPDNRAPDLVALRTRQVDDPFSRFTMRLFSSFFRHFGRYFTKVDPVLGVRIYKDETTRNFARYLKTLFAFAILVGSINILYFISSTVGRLIAIFAFNILFALCLLFFAKGTPMEVFSATSA